MLASVSLGAASLDRPEPAQAAPTDFTATSPARLVDTRPGFTTIDGIHQATGRIRANQVARFRIAGRGGVPASAAGVAITVTAVGPLGAGHLTAWNCAQPMPRSSNLNFTSSTQAIANLVVSDLDPSGHICVSARAETHILVDAYGYLPRAATIEPTRPTRLTDTRSTQPVEGGTTVIVDVGDRLDAALLSVIAVNPTARGHLTVYPCGQPRPNASQLNYRAGTTIANTAIVPIGLDGTVCVYASATTDVVVDHLVHINPNEAIRAINPARLLDTREGFSTIDHEQRELGRRVPGEVTRVIVADRADIPADPVAALLTITAVNPEASGHLTAYRCGEPIPNASILNYQPGATIAATTIAPVGDDGTLCISTAASTDLVVDVAGYVTGARDSLSAGGTHTCTIDDQRVACWGSNQSGQLGNGSLITTTQPQTIAGLAATDVATGGNHTCALTTAQAVYCWGDNSHGQLGTGTTTPQLLPTLVTGLPPVSNITAGDFHTCATTTDNALYCWGNNTFGQIGAGASDPQPTPRLAASITSTQASAGGDTTCSIGPERTVHCWGNNSHGQLGHTAPPASPTPTLIDITDAATVAVGYQHICATTVDRTTYCWGSNTHGQLGTPAGPNQPTPRAVPGLPPAIAVNAGHGRHTCAITTNSHLYCWGDNTDQQVDTSGNNPAPVTRLDATPDEVALGDRHTCSRSDNVVACWGDNTFGQLGTP